MRASSRMCGVSMSATALMNSSSSSDLRVVPSHRGGQGTARARRLSRRAVSSAIVSVRASSSSRRSSATAFSTNSSIGSPAASAASSRVSATCADLCPFSERSTRDRTVSSTGVSAVAAAPASGPSSPAPPASTATPVRIPRARGWRPREPLPALPEWRVRVSVPTVASTSPASAIHASASLTTSSVPCRYPEASDAPKVAVPGGAGAHRDA